MKTKKFLALAVALLMALSVVSVSAEPAVKTSVEATTSKVVYEGTEFVLDVKVTPGDAAKKLRAFQFDFTYDTEKVELTSVDQIGLLTPTVPYAAGQMTAGAQTVNRETGVVKFSFTASSPFIAAGLDLPADGKIVSFAFTAKTGESAVGSFIKSFDKIKFEDQNVVAEKLEDNSLTNATVLENMVVNEIPNAPSVDVTGGITGTFRAGQTVTANYAFNNGATVNNTADDASEIVWYAGADVVKEATAADKELTLTPAMVGKTIKYEVTPMVDRAEMLNPLGTKQTSAVSEVVKAATGYTLTADVNTDIENDEIIATRPATVLVALDDTYPEEAVVNGTTYAWYILPLVTEGDDYTVETAKLATLEGDPAFTTATATFAPENRDQWVVVVVTPKATIAGEEFTAEAVKFAAKITGEPPVLDDVADGSALAAKKIYTNTLMTISEAQVKFISNAVGDDASIDYTYNWYLATSADDESPVEITGEAILKDGAQIRLGKVADAEGKYLVLVVTGTDTRGISATVEIFFENAIAKASNASGTAGGASLSAGGVVVPPTEEPGDEPGTDEPGTDEPAGNEDPSGDAIANGAAAFTDVDKEAYAWAYEGIDTLAKAGVIKGMTETTFGPELTATNAQMIALAVRIAGLTAEDATTDKVDAEHWVAEEAAIAEAKGILGVYGDKIDVEGEVTREVAFTLLYNALKAAGVELSESAEAIEFTDAASIDANCVEAINALVKAGIVNGMGDGTLAPKATLTRAQLAKILGLANALITK